MMKRLSSLVWIFLCWGIVSCLVSAAPRISIEFSEGWSERINYDPPDQQKTKWLLTGTNAVSIPGRSSQIQLKGLKLTQFSLSDADHTDLTAESPEAIFDPQKRELSSSSRLEVDAQSGNFQLQGTGFLLQNSNSTLNISNDVRSSIRNSTATDSAASKGFVQIDSHFCEFRIQTAVSNGVAVYQDKVTVRDARLEMNCERLTAAIPSAGKSGSAAPDFILAQTNVEIDFRTEKGEPVHASCSRAAYLIQIENNATNQILELTGTPKITLANGSMSADYFLINRTTGSIRGEKNVRFHYFGMPSLASVFGSETNSKTQQIDISSDHFNFDDASHVAIFESDVSVHQSGMDMQSGYLVIHLPAKDSGVAGHFNQIVAETNVVIHFVDGRTSGTNRAMAQKAVYEFKPTANATNEVIQLDGNPMLLISNAVIRADVIYADRAQNKIYGKGNHHTIWARTGGEMNSEAFSDNFSYSSLDEISVFEGNVRFFDPSMNLSGSKVVMKLAKPQPGRTNSIESIVATGRVGIDFASKPFSPKDITNLIAIHQVFDLPVGNGGGIQKRELLNKIDWLKLSQSDTDHPVAETELKRLFAERLNLICRQEGSLDATTGRKGAELAEANRQLLLDIFRGGISANPAAELMHGTGEMASYHYTLASAATNEMVELTGHPRLDWGNRWVVADESITSDRLTGRTRFMGRPHFFTRMQGLTTNKLPVSPTKGKSR